MELWVSGILSPCCPSKTGTNQLMKAWSPPRSYWKKDWRRRFFGPGSLVKNDMETLVRKVQVTGIHLQGPKAAIFRQAWSRVLSMKIADYWFHDMMEILIFNVDFGVKASVHIQNFHDLPCMWHIARHGVTALEMLKKIHLGNGNQGIDTSHLIANSLNCWSYQLTWYFVNKYENQTKFHAISFSLLPSYFFALFNTGKQDQQQHQSVLASTNSMGQHVFLPNLISALSLAPTIKA